MTTPLDVAARLTRLAIALEMREGVTAPVLAAIAASGGRGDVVVGAAAHGRRMDIVMPWSPAGLAALGGDAAKLPAGVAPVGIRARVDGDAVSAAVLARGGAADPRGAVDELAPPAARAAWFDVVDQFCAIAGGKIGGKTRWLDGRVALEIRYPARDPAANTDAYLLEAVDQLGAQLGVTAPQRALWQKLHVGFRGVELALTTACTAGGAVSQVLALAYPLTEWERAVHMAQGTTLDAAEAAKVPRQLGALAGALGSDQLQSVELELGPHEPLEVVVWAKLAPA